ncbi:MAG TPA: outer membrane beta-barrel protein [Stellaceae bacterium]
MKRLRAGRLAVAGVWIGMTATGGMAAAQDMEHPTLARDNLHVGIAVGPIFPEDMSARLSGTITGSGQLSFNPAGAVAGFAGYDLTERLAAEAEIGWTLYDPFKLSGSFVGPGGPLPSIALNGNFDTIIGLVNVLYRPLGNKGRFLPYLGAGIGFAHLDWSVSSQPNAAALDVSGSAFDFAADIAAGLDYALTDKLSLGGRYRYLWINSDGGTLAGGGVVLTHGDVHAHVLTANARYRF